MQYPCEVKIMFYGLSALQIDVVVHKNFVFNALQVTLVPGDLLYVPRHWWHYVESVGEEPTVSINTWVEIVS